MKIEVSINVQISNVMKIRPVGVMFFHADRRTGRHEKANSRFSQVCKCAYMTEPICQCLQPLFNLFIRPAEATTDPAEKLAEHFCYMS